MLKRLLTPLLLTLLLFTGNAQAQNWFGVRSGWPLGVTVHYGIDNGLSRGFDLRVSGRVFARGSAAVTVGVGVDALRDVFIEPPFSVYIGGGPAVEFGSDLFLLDVHGLVGAEFRFIDLGMPQLGLFVEGSLGATLDLSGGGDETRIPDVGAAVGVNFRF